MSRPGDTLTRRATTRPDRPLPPRPPRRGLASKLDLAHGLMVLSGLLAFVLIAAVLGDRSERVVVAVARADLAAGEPLDAQAVRAVRVPVDSQLTQRLVAIDEVRRGRWLAASAITAGDPVRRSDLMPADDGPRLRAMSIPVARENAVGGALRVGDLVDVIDVVEGRSAFVVAGAQVTKVSAPSTSGGLTRGVERAFYVVVQVSAEQALALAQALADGKVDVVRASGADPLVLAPEPASAPAPTWGAKGEGAPPP